MATIGQTVSHYILERKIGSGSFGDVFYAKDTRNNQPVAIKCSKAAEKFALPDYQQRFLREVECTKILTHPNIVRLLDSGTLEDGSFFLVMNYIDGVSLESIIKREAPLPFMRAARIVLQILDALSDAHAKGIVHRDLTPANIMITRQGIRRDFVQLLDFGIAKAFDGTQPDLTSQNLSKDMGFGTPQYMPPEQIYANNIGPYTDIYAVGLVFFEMITATQPMQGPSVIDTIKKQLSEQIVVPPPFNDGPLADIFRMAFAKDYTQRYQNAADIYADIDDLLNSMSPYLSAYSQVSDIDFQPLTSPVSKTSAPPKLQPPKPQLLPPLQQRPSFSKPQASPSQAPASRPASPLPKPFEPKPTSPLTPAPKPLVQLPPKPSLADAFDEIDESDEASTQMVDPSELGLERPEFATTAFSRPFEPPTEDSAPITVNTKYDADDDCKTSISLSAMDDDEDEDDVSEIRTALVVAPSSMREFAPQNPPKPSTQVVRKPQQYIVNSGHSVSPTVNHDATRNIAAFVDPDERPLAARTSAVSATMTSHKGFGNLQRADYLRYSVKNSYTKFANQFNALHIQTVILIISVVFCFFLLILLVVILATK